ncbi:MAG: sensor histidine kinase [Anaerostipes sp.]
MSKSEKKRIILKIILMAFILFLTLFGNSNWVMNRKLEKQEVSLLSHWNYVNNQLEQKEITVPAKEYAKSNDTQILKKKVTKSMLKDEEGLSIGFYTVCQEVTVYMNKTCIYERKASPGILTGWAAASGWNFAKIGKSKPGDEITVQLTSPYSMTSGSIPSFYLGSEANLKRLPYSKSSRYFFLDSIILFLGLFWIVHYLYMKRSKIVHKGGIELGILAITLAGWFYFGSSYHPNIWISDEVACYLAESFFILVPLVYSIVLREVTVGKLNQLIQLVVDISFVNIIVCQALHIFRICDLMETIYVIHILIVVLISITFVYYWNRIQQGDLKWTSVETSGGITLTISAFIELYYTYFFSLEQFGIAIRVGVIVYVIAVELMMMREERDAEYAFLENENRVKEMRLKILSSQIQPHFIYNTLGSIQGLIQIDSKEASRLTYMFSKYLRGNIDFVDSPMEVDFTKELNHIYTYGEIEKIRFGDRVNIIYDINETNFTVPALSLQPLIENGIKHGICKKDEGGTVKLTVRRHGDYVRIIVEDDGVGFDAKKVLENQHSSVGLRNSIYRWREYNHAKVTVESHINEGTKITIIFRK